MSHALYPMKCKPICKEKVWGGKRMASLLGKNYSPLPNCGESWELSGLPGESSVVSNGFLAGNELSELIEVYMGDLLGDKVFDHYGKDFPLLFKFLDTDDDLSVQVHPDDALALERHQGRGKTEMWYVIAAEEGAEMILGFREDLSPELFRKHLEENRLGAILKKEKVRAGDVFYIPAGQVHAIGKGITLCEIQQSSDITYRIYDWDRPGLDGKPRKLHIEEAMDAIQFRAFDSRIQSRSVPDSPEEIIQSPYFTVRKLNFRKNLEMDYLFVDSFVVYTCLEGACLIGYQGGEEWIVRGETLLLPAELKSIRLSPKKHCLLLETYMT